MSTKVRTALLFVIGITIESLLCFSARAVDSRVSTSAFGKLQTGESVQQFTLTNAHGMQVKLIEFGATLTEILVPDKTGKMENILLGSDSIEAYERGFPAGSVIGRYANRIRNARFTIDGKEFNVSKNAGQNHIHGGQMHFGKLRWKGTASTDPNVASVTFQYTSRDGEEGFPGNLDVAITYTLTSSNELVLDYTAKTDQPTVINLTNHAYFNLSGAGDVLDHELQMESDETTTVDKLLIPTGEFTRVEGGPLDFRQFHKIGARIQEVYHAANGYDHNYVIRGDAGTLRTAARVVDHKSGRTLECLTTEPGVQLYTSNGFHGKPYPKHGAFCLETQHYPDSPNHGHFPTTIVRPGKPFTSKTIFRFGTIEVLKPSR
jgi:aldose 1-epimerase